MTIGDIIIIVLIVLSFFLESYLKKKAENRAEKQDIKDISYESEKGKNTATKEDVKVITEKVESIKGKYEKANIAYEVDYSVYYNERSKSLIDLYRKLANEYKTGLYMAGIWKLYQDKSIDSKVYDSLYIKAITKYTDALEQAGSAITFCRIFLDRDFCNEIDNFEIKVANYANKYLDLISRDDVDVIKMLELYNEFSGIASELYDYAEKIRAMILPGNNEDK